MLQSGEVQSGSQVSESHGMGGYGLLATRVPKRRFTILAGVSWGLPSSERRNGDAHA